MGYLRPEWRYIVNYANSYNIGPFLARFVGQHPFVISRVGDIRLLASPLRQAVIDAVAANGPLTVAEIGRLLRRRPDRVYYHVKLLARAGMLVASAGQSSSGRSEARFDVPGRPLMLLYDPASPANRREVARVVAAMLRGAGRDFRKGFLAEDVVVTGPRRNLWAGRVQGNLTAVELTEANVLIDRLSQLMHGSSHRVSSRTRLHQLTWVLSPGEDT